MTTKSFKIFLVVSLLLHLTLLMVFVRTDRAPSSLESLWQGGGSGNPGNVVLIDLHDVQISPSESNSLQNTAANPLIAHTQNNKKKIPNQTASQNTSQPQQIKSIPGSGDGSGNSTGNGHGSGLDEIGSADPNTLARIRKKILSAKRYPQKAQSAGESGQVTVAFRIAEDGSISMLNLVHSSGFKDLDQAALATIKRAAPLPYYPKMIELVLEYQLKEDDTW